MARLIPDTVKPVLSVNSKGRTKIGFQDRLSVNAGQKYCRMLQESILQYFLPSISCHLSVRPLFCLFSSGCLRQVLLYTDNLSETKKTVLDCHLSLSLLVVTFIVC